MSAQPEQLRSASVVGVRMELPSNQPIVLLREDEGERYLPIWIGAVEAAAIANVQQGVVTARPLTHDLIRDLLVATGQELSRIEIIDLQDKIFYADLVFSDGTRVSARPSDAIAIALRLHAEILVAASVLDDAGIVLSSDDTDDSEIDPELDEDFDPESVLDDDEAAAGERRSRRAHPSESVVPESEMEKFREFLDTITPEDFSGS